MFLSICVYADSKKITEIKQINKSVIDSRDFQAEMEAIIAHLNQGKKQNTEQLSEFSEQTSWIFNTYIVYSNFDTILQSGELDLLVSYIEKENDITNKVLFKDKLRKFLLSNLDNGALTITHKNLIKLLKRDKDLQQSYKFAKYCYERLINIGDREFLLELIATNADYRQLSPTIKKETDIIIKKTKPLMQHLYAQLKFNNYSYLIQKLPPLIKKFENQEWLYLNKLEKLYIEVLTRKRLYTKLIQNLKSQHFFKTLTSGQLLSIQAELYIKKGFISNANHIIQGKSIDPKTRNILLSEIGNYYYDKQKYIESAGYYNKIDFKYIENKIESEIKWRIAFTLMRQNQNKVDKQLRAIFKWSEKFNFEESEDGARFCYWNNRYNKSKNETDILSCFKKYPNTFYGLYALIGYNENNKTPYRLRALNYISGNEKFAVLFQVLNKLYFEKHEDLAEYIIGRFMHENKHSLRYQEGFLQLLFKQMQYNVAISLIYHHYADIEKIGKDYFYKQILQYDYPLAYRNLVNQSQKVYELPRYFINAVIREESKVRNEVESRAGAVGLMQLMPQTAKYLNKFLKLKGKLDLTKPEVNIKIGAFYLKRLHKRYKGNLFYILAAYNAGPTNANRWIRKMNIEEETFFLESISFSETRNYVKRVFKSFYIYQILYETKN